MSRMRLPTQKHILHWSGISQQVSGTHLCGNLGQVIDRDGLGLGQNVSGQCRFEINGTRWRKTQGEICVYVQ